MHTTHEIEQLAEHFGAKNVSVDRTSRTAVRVRVQHPTDGKSQDALRKKIEKATGLQVEVMERTA